MKKSILITLFFCLACGMGLSAQNLEGRYAHAKELNANEMEINQIVLSEGNATFTGNWETALATGENEVITPLQNLAVNKQDLTLSFVKAGQAYTGKFVDDGEGGYDLIIDGQTLYSKSDW